MVQRCFQGNRAVVASIGGTWLDPQALFLRDLVPRPGTNGVKGFAYRQIFGTCLTKVEFKTLLAQATYNFSTPPQFSAYIRHLERPTTAQHP